MESELYVIEETKSNENPNINCRIRLRGKDLTPAFNSKSTNYNVFEQKKNTERTKTVRIITSKKINSLISRLRGGLIQGLFEIGPDHHPIAFNWEYIFFEFVFIFYFLLEYTDEESSYKYFSFEIINIFLLNILFSLTNNYSTLAY